MRVGGEVLGMLAPLRAERLIAEEPGDGKAFGLDAPGLSLTWSSRPEGGERAGETSQNRKPCGFR